MGIGVTSAERGRNVDNMLSTRRDRLAAHRSVVCDAAASRRVRRRLDDPASFGPVYVRGDCVSGRRGVHQRDLAKPGRLGCRVNHTELVGRCVTKRCYGRRRGHLDNGPVSGLHVVRSLERKRYRRGLALDAAPLGSARRLRREGHRPDASGGLDHVEHRRQDVDDQAQAEPQVERRQPVDLEGRDLLLEARRQPEAVLQLGPLDERRRHDRLAEGTRLLQGLHRDHRAG